MSTTKPDKKTSPVGAAGADEVVARLRRTFQSDRTRSVAWRRAQLEGLLRLLTEREQDLAEAIEADLGRSAIGTFMGDVAPVTAEIKHTLKDLQAWAKPRKVSVPATQQPGKAWIHPQPKGVVLVIGAWNFPALLTLQPLVSALAAGNTVVIKPSELAPASSRFVAELLPEYVDPSAVAVMEGGAEVTTALLEQQLDHVFFTGSTSVGSIVAQACAKSLTPVTLELGGKSPVIVAADADLDVAARRITWAKHVNGGQACIAPDYVLVEDAVRPQLVEKLLTHMGPAGQAAPTRIVNDGHLDRLESLLASHGGHTTGGEIRRDQRRISSAVVTDPELDSPLMNEEIFGPILPVMSVDSVDHAIDFVNNRSHPLALYVFTSNDETADHVIERTTSGSVGINHLMYQLLVPNLPFGGIGTSGTGSYHGRFGFDTFSHLKAVLKKPTSIDPPFTYPPYGRAAQRLLRQVMG